MTTLLVPQPEPVTTRPPRYERTGRCGFCLHWIETDQNNPSEATTRHVDGVPYGQCVPGKRERGE